MFNYFFAMASIVAGITCLFIAKSKKYFKYINNKYGEAAANKLSSSLKFWGYFLLIAAGILIISLLFEGTALK
jgi:hypothetical protein